MAAVDPEFVRQRISAARDLGVLLGSTRPAVCGGRWLIAAWREQ